MHYAVDVVKKCVQIKAIVLSREADEWSLENWPDAKWPALKFALGEKASIFSLSPGQFVEKFLWQFREFLHIVEISAGKQSEHFITSFLPVNSLRSLHSSARRMSAFFSWTSLRPIYLRIESGSGYRSGTDSICSRTCLDAEYDRDLHIFISSSINSSALISKSFCRHCMSEGERHRVDRSLHALGTRLPRTLHQ